MANGPRWVLSLQSNAHLRSFLRITSPPSLIIMRVTLLLLAFIFLGVAAAGIIPEISVRDDTVAGGNDAFPPFPFPFPFPFPTPPLIPVDVADHLEPTRKHSRFVASQLD